MRDCQQSLFVLLKYPAASDCGGVRKKRWDWTHERRRL